MTARSELRDLILGCLNAACTESGRKLFVTRRLNDDKLVCQRRRLFESDAREQPFLIVVRAAPDELRIGDDRAIRVPAQIGA